MLFDLSKQILNDVQKALDKSSDVLDEAGLSQTRFQSILENAFRKHGLVTREEFDAQQAVLMRTREKVEALEAALKQLEALANNQEPEN